MNISNSTDNTVIVGSGGADTIYIYNGGHYSTIDAGDSDDSIQGDNLHWSSVNAGAGNDTITGNYNYSTVLAGASDDYIEGGFYMSSLDGGEGDDYLYNWSSQGTLHGGLGDDTIYAGGERNVIEYASGDGNDTIYYFDSTDTLRITDGEITSTLRADNDFILNIGTSSITFKDIGDTPIKVIQADEQLSLLNYSGIMNLIPNTIVNGTTGNDTIYNFRESATINAGSGDDFVYNDVNVDNVLINTGDGNDTILQSNYNNYTTINAGDGDDSIQTNNVRYYSSVNAGAGNDSIYGNYYYSTILAGTGDDYLQGGFYSSSVEGGEGNDYIYTWDSYGTLHGGFGDDTIYAGGERNVIEYASGDDNDTIYYFDSTDTLRITDGEITSTRRANNDFILNIGSNSITFKDVGDTLIKVLDSYEKLHVLNFPGIINLDSDTMINGSDSGDTIYNSGNNVTINTGAGNDSIRNEREISNLLINAGDGDNYIYNDYYGYYVTVNTGDGSDTIYNRGYYTYINSGVGNDFIESQHKNTVDAGDGDDTLQGWDSYQSIDGGAGDDCIVGGYNYSTIRGGTGNDALDIYYDYNEFQYASGDGDDTIFDWQTNDTLNITDGTPYTTMQSDNDIIIQIGSGSITLKDAANKAINITGADYGTELYNTEGNTLISGTNGNDSIENQADNVTISSGDGNDYIYNWSNNASINGGRGNDTIKLNYSNGVIQYANGDGNDVINGFNDAFTLSIADGSINGYSINGDDLILNVGDGAINLKNYIGGRVNVLQNGTLTTQYFGPAFVDTQLSNTLIAGTEYDDTINVGGEEVTAEGGAGADVINNYGMFGSMNGNAGNDSISNLGEYSAINGGDDNDHIINDEGGSYSTLNGGDGNDYIQNDGAMEVLIFGDAGNDSVLNRPSGNGNGSNNTIDGGAGNDYINNDSDRAVINGGDENDSIENTGSGSNASLNGGNGNDYIYNSNNENVTVEGGAGDDTIELDQNGYTNTLIKYDPSEGNDVIVGYKPGDTVKFSSGAIGDYSISGNDVIVKIGNGSLTFKEARGQQLHFVDPDGKEFIKVYGTSSFQNDIDDISVETSRYFDYVINTGKNVTLDTGDGKDTISNYGVNTNINAGVGNDVIYLESAHSQNVIKYASGDGNDTLYGLNNYDALQITDGSDYSTLRTDNDMIVSIGSGSITVKDIDNQKINISGGNFVSIKPVEDDTTVSDVFNSIVNVEDDTLINGTSDNDYITNTGSNVTIQAGAGDDTITGSTKYGEMFLFSYESGNDVITNFDKNDSLKSTSGTISDVQTIGNNVVVTIKKENQSAVGIITLQGAVELPLVLNDNVLTVETDDVTTINNTQSDKKIVGTDGRDFITNTGSNVTIQAGKGADTITGSTYGELFIFDSVDGDNVITNFSTNDSIKFSSGSASTAKSGNDFIVSVGSARITLRDAATLPFALNNNLLIVDAVNTINNKSDNVELEGEGGRDLIINTGNHVTITGGAGNDTISGSDIYDDLFMFAYNHGNDVITNFGNRDTLQITDGTLSTTKSGDDLIVSVQKSNTTGKVTLKGAANIDIKKSGNAIIADVINYIDNTKNNIKVSGTDGRDFISSTGSNVTVVPGKGNDTVDGSDFYGDCFIFSSADGNNLITNFNANDSLKASDGTITTQPSGDDAIVTITKSKVSSKITLEGAANLPFAVKNNVLTVKNIPTLESSADNTKLTGTNVDEYLIGRHENISIQAGKGNDTIEGSEYDETFMFSHASNDDVILNFDEYDTLKATSGSISSVETVGNDLLVTITKGSTKGTILLNDAAAFKYKHNTSALWIDRINYIEATKNNQKVTGTTDIDYITNTEYENVTVQAGKGNDTIEGSDIYGEQFWFSYASNDDVIVNFRNNDTLKATSGSISKVETVGNDVVVSISKSGQSDVGHITLQGVADYNFKKSGSYLIVDNVNRIVNTRNNTLVGGSDGKDYISNTGENVTIDGAGGNDTLDGSDSFGDVFVFNALGGEDLITNFNANDTLKITEGNIQSRAKVGNDYVVNVKDSNYIGTITLKGSGALDFKQRDNTLIVGGVNPIVNSSNKKKIIGTDFDDLITNAGSKVTINGAGGNDTLEGSSYGEIFQFSSDGGNDVILNFGKNDSLQIVGGSIKSREQNGDDYVVTVKSQIYTGTITLKNAGHYLFNEAGNVLTVANVNYMSNSGDGIKVTGTGKADFITNSGQNVTLGGGAGNDTFEGSTFGEVFLFAYNSGNDVVTNFGLNDTLRITSGTLSTTKSGDDLLVKVTKSGKSSTMTLKDAGNYKFKKSGSALFVDNINEIINDVDNKKITGSTGRDVIYNTGEHVTIQAGKGDDVITGSDLYGERFLFSYASGNDTITNFSLGDTVQSTSGTLSYKQSGNDVVVTIKKGSTSGTVTLQDAAGYVFKQTNNYLTVETVNEIDNGDDNIKVTGTTGRDYITNSGENVSIQAGKGNDTIDGSIFGETFMFSYAAGNNLITNFGSNDTLRNTSGTMSYKVNGDDVVVSITKSKTTATITLEGAAAYSDLIKKTSTALYVDGINVLENTEDSQKITGSTGRDYIANTGEHVTIQAGKGDDIITGSDSFGERFLFSCASGDDTITNFGLGDTIQSTSGTISFKQAGNDYTVSIKKGSTIGTITLTDAATNYTLQKDNNNLIASPKVTSNAQMPSDYWFLNEEQIGSPLERIVEKEAAVDLPTDFMADVLKQKTNVLIASARKH